MKILSKKKMNGHKDNNLEGTIAVTDRLISFILSLTSPLRLPLTAPGLWPAPHL